MKKEKIRGIFSKIWEKTKKISIIIHEFSFVFMVPIVGYYNLISAVLVFVILLIGYINKD